MGGVRTVSSRHENPVIQVTFRRSASLLKGPNPVATAILIGVAFAIAILGPMSLGICGCTMFTLAAVALILATSLGVGNSALGALTLEREKKTLDALRLTQLSAHEVLFGKLLPELGNLAVIVLMLAPTVVAAGLWGPETLTVTFGAVAIAILAGLFASVLGLFMSSVFETTSQAVVAGWIAKGVWLILTPALDMVVGALLVQNVSPPVFTSINPLAAFGVLDVPEAAVGTRLLLPLLFPLATLVVGGLLWMITARRYASGMVSGGGMRDRVVHSVYRRGFGPDVLQRWFPGFRNNPAFVRELASQVRAGAGRWPGYLVFVVLFLAPSFYSRSWTLNDLALANAAHSGPAASLCVEDSGSGPSASEQGGVAGTGSGVHLATWVPASGSETHGTRVDAVLKGHTSTGCLRLFLLQSLGVPLPADQLCFIVRKPSSIDARQIENVHVETADQVDPRAAARFGLGPQADVRPLEKGRREAAERASLRVGMVGAIVLLLLYVSIRYSAFLATAVTGERARRTWEDLALTGIPVREAMKGKVLGAVLLPVLQMTLAFPVLTVFVAMGNLTFGEVCALYVYALAVSLAATTLGLWASARTATSHDANLRALSMVLAGFLVLPVLLPLVSGYAFFGVLLVALTTWVSRRKPVLALAWAGLGVLLAVAPETVSPLTALVTFMPSLSNGAWFLAQFGLDPHCAEAQLLSLVCAAAAMFFLSVIFWEGAMEAITDGHDGNAIAAEVMQPASSAGLLASP